MTAADLRELLDAHLARHRMPGAALAILRDGHVRAAYAGITDVRTGQAVTPMTRFAVGSLSKSMVATSLTMLASAGRLTLDDALCEHVPELRSARWARRATIRDMLANRSGMPLRAAWEFEDLPGTDDTVLSRLASIVAEGEPTAAGWSYTNVGWCLLGRVIETVTNLTWEQAMQTHLFDPLGMRETTFTTRPLAEPRAVGHDPSAEHGWRPLPAWETRAFGPAGATILSTVGDLMRFAAFHLREPVMAGLRESNADIRIHGWLDGWGLGWARFDWTDEVAWGWDGVVPGQRMVLRLLPERQTAILLATNAAPGRILYRSLFAELPAWAGVSMPPLNLKPSPLEDLDRYVGTYAWPDRRYVVSVTDEGLLIEREGRQMSALPLSEGAFLVDPADPDNPALTFAGFDADGRAGVLYSMLWGFPRELD